MRPIRLEFAGLQSYREKQEIDFAELLGGGLFGIFGPTGAGKSTILDAITLALYGRVGRAERGTSGIMNQAENRLWVKFCFGLGTEEYRVERSYKREKETVSIRSEHARLVRVRAEGDEVMADREREVTQQVTDLLGLQLEDFTRAVVLPQGQFAEFLKLTGRDRTQMLQRIFSLTQYGDRLTQRLKQRVEAVKGQLIAVQSEQLGLGDASEEAVKAADRALTEAEAALAKAERELSELEAQVKGWERVWELQQELNQVGAGLRQWQERAVEAEGWQDELTAARRAEGVRPHLEARDAARTGAQQAGERLAVAERSLEGAQRALAAAVAAHEEARRRRMAEGPSLVRRQGELQRAAALEADLGAAQLQVQDLEERVRKGQALCADVARRLVEGDGRRQGLLAQDEQLRERLAAVDVTAEERSQVMEAQRRLDRLREAEGALSDAVKRLEQREAQLRLAEREAEQAEALSAAARSHLQELEVRLARLEAEPPAADEDLRAQEAWLSRAGELLRVLAERMELVQRLQAEQESRQGEARAAAAQVEVAQAEEQRLRAELSVVLERRDASRIAVDEARRQAHAAALVGTLTAGEPCPVCGSREHPHPASLAEAQDLTMREAQLEEAERTLRQAELALERTVQQRAAAAERASAAAERAAEAAEALVKAETQLSAARERLPQGWRTLGPAELEQALAQDAAEHEERKARHQQWQSEVADLRKQREERSAAAAQAAAEASARLATARAAAQGVAEAAEERTAQTESLRQRQAEFDAVRGEMDAAGVAAAQRRIEAADREARTLRQTMDKLRKEQQALEQELANLRRKEQEYTQLLHQRQLELAQAVQRHQEIEGEWTRLAGGSPAAPQLAAVEAALRQMEEDETAATLARNEAEKRCGQAESVLAAARRESELAAERVAHTAAALDQALAAAGFADDAAARSALRPLDRQAALEAQVRSYEQEGVRLQSRRDALTQQLGGRSLTSEEWQGWQDRLVQVRTATVARREEKARCMQVRDDLQAKQRRWQELEEQRTALATQANNLEDLRSLLRGNAFVDFLAEEQMSRVAAEASLRLRELTRFRYALQTEPGGGFLVRDDGNGGTCRAVSTLSGGETFLASLSLALALSAQIQLRGHYPLEFFFLDEGFGTLDPALLDLVISTLERLHFEKLHVGIISHVAELRSRLQRRVIVEPAEPGGRGSRVMLERA